MKPKILNKYLNKEYPYELFSIENNFPLNINPHNYIPKSSKHRELPSKTQSKARPMTTIGRLPSAVSSISKSLKSVTLSSQLYGDYINFHSNITQEHTFKTPRMDKYPLLKNEQFLPITFHSSRTLQSSKKEKINFSTDTTKSIFLSYMKEVKPTKKVIEEKPYGFKYGTTKIRFDRAKSAKIYMAKKDFNELNEHNLFETKFLDLIGLKKIDLYNSTEEKKKNFKFFNDYLKKSNELKDIFNENNFYRNISFDEKTAIQKDQMNFKLEIYSLCLKFYSLNDSKNNIGKNKESHKLYFPFDLMPLFYLLDLTSFKVFLSEIITYDQDNNCFTYIKENIILKKLKRYYNYISNSIENKPKYINNITFNKNEINFPLIYDWLVSKNLISEKEEETDNKNIESKFNKKYQCYKLKIVLPKIKFSIENLSIKIIKYLNKHMIAILLQHKFKDWHKYIFCDLFSTKRFKIITNLIMLNKQYRIHEKKIRLYKEHKVQNKVYDFFLTQIGENNNSHFYIFVPYIILILFGEKNKKFQKIYLSLKESKNIDKFGKYWGIMNTLFKCMFIDKMKNKIFFKLDSLEDEKNELYKVILEENSKQNILVENKNNINIDYSISNLNYGSNKKVIGKNSNIREKEKEKDNFQNKYKDNNFEISLLNCSLLKINIASNKLDNKYYKIPPNLLKTIFSIKDENKIFNTNCSNISLISKCIGENSKLILSSKEADIIQEEQAFIKKAKIKDELYKVEKNEPPPPRHPNGFNRLKTIELLQNNSNMKLESKKDEDIKDKNNLKIKEKREKLGKKSDNNVIKYLNQKELEFNKNYSKKVSIHNLNHLRKSRIEHGTRKDSKKITLKKNNEDKK